MTHGGARRASVWAGGAFAVLCLAIFVHDADWSGVAAALAEAELGTIAAASVLLLLTMVGRAWRWQALLGVEGVRFRHRLTSTVIGFAGNNVLPGRLGEPLRCLVLARLDRRVRLGRAAGSLVVERVFDLAAALIALVAFLVAAPFVPEAAERQAAFLSRLETFGGLLAAAVLGGALVLFLAARPSHAPQRSGWRGRLATMIAHVRDGFGSLRSPTAILVTVGYTAVVWIAMLLYDLGMLRAFGFDQLGLAHALGLLVVLSFAIALPQAPAGIGVIQLATQTTLAGLYGVPLVQAKAFAVGLWGCQVLVVVAAGVVAVWLEGLSLAEVRAARRQD